MLPPYSIEWITPRWDGITPIHDVSPPTPGNPPPPRSAATLRQRLGRIGAGRGARPPASSITEVSAEQPAPLIADVFAGHASASGLLVGVSGTGKSVATRLWSARLVQAGVGVVYIDGRGGTTGGLAQQVADSGHSVEVFTGYRAKERVTPPSWNGTALTIYNGNPYRSWTQTPPEQADYYGYYQTILRQIEATRQLQPPAAAPLVVILDNTGAAPHLAEDIQRAFTGWRATNTHLWLTVQSLVAWQWRSDGWLNPVLEGAALWAILSTSGSDNELLARYGHLTAEQVHLCNTPRWGGREGIYLWGSERLGRACYGTVQAHAAEQRIVGDPLLDNQG